MATATLSIDDRLQIEHQINRVSRHLRSDPSAHERFVLQSQLIDLQERLQNPDVFEQKRREFFGEDYR